MKMQLTLGLILVAGGGSVCAQQPPKSEGARELFYFGASAKDTLPPIRKVAASDGGKATPRPLPAAPKKDETPTSPNTGAAHLGFRYNLVLVNQTSGKSETADSDRVFRKGECVAIDIESNRSGYLYVLVKQSSGDWRPLFPSAEMTDQSNIVDPKKNVRVPSGYCFEIADPPGTEALTVVLSRDPRDFYELYEGIKGPAAPATQPKPSTGPIEVADARIVNSAVAHMAEQFGTRDLVIRKVSQPANTQDPPSAVYVVNASDRPSSTIVARIEIHHR